MAFCTEFFAAFLIAIASVPACLSQSRFGQSATSYTNNLIPSLNRRDGFAGSGVGVGIGIGRGSGAAGVGIGIGVGGVDEFGNPIGGGFAGGFPGVHRINRCGGLAPECLPTPLDSIVECKYVYDPSLGTCVKIDVIPACSPFGGAASNLFDTLLDCQRYCL